MSKDIKGHDMEIRKAKKSDLIIILEMQKASFFEIAQRHDDFDIPPMTQTIEGLEDEFPLYDIYVAVKDRKCVGTIRCEFKGDTCEIGRVVVNKEYQNLGIGKKLMAYIEKTYSDIKRFELFTGSKDPKNLYFYESFGYKEFKRRPYKNCDLIYFEKLK